MLTPFAYVFAAPADVALIGVVVLGANLVSTFWYQYHIEYHYSLVVVPAWRWARCTRWPRSSITRG